MRRPGKTWRARSKRGGLSRFRSGFPSKPATKASAEDLRARFGKAKSRRDAHHLRRPQAERLLPPGSRQPRGFHSEGSEIEGRLTSLKSRSATAKTSYLVKAESRRPKAEIRPNRRGRGPKAAFPKERGTSGRPNRRSRRPRILAPESNPASASSLKSDPTQAVQPGPPHPLSQSRPHPHRRVRRAALPQPSCPVPSQPTVRHLARRQARLRRRPRCAPS